MAYNGSMEREYFTREEIEKQAPEILQEWDQWLRDNFDPGYYDSYKVREQSILPYVNGQPQWVTETYMPPHLRTRIQVTSAAR